MSMTKALGNFFIRFGFGYMKQRPLGPVLVSMDTNSHTCGQVISTLLLGLVFHFFQKIDHFLKAVL